MARSEDQIDRLYDAIDLVKEDKREEACDILRELIREDNNFEAAWLWMSIAVDNLDQSALCLDNVLRINPNNIEAAIALQRMQAMDTLMEDRRSKLRGRRDTAFLVMWFIIIFVMCMILVTYSRLYVEFIEFMEGTQTAIPPGLR